MLTDTDQNPKTHIDSITKRYVENPLSQTLANLSNTVIETALSGQSKFLFEILQNADDAICEQQTSVKIKFSLYHNYLIIRHNGKGFDYNDIERICDYASQIEEVKATDLNKTGYKGLGFKALFNVSNCIILYSNGYSFRFDKTHWQASDLIPWQIIPIWCDDEQLPFHESYDYQHKYVNFVLKLTDAAAVKQQLKAMIQQPEALLFLRQINQLNINIEGEKHHLERVITAHEKFQRVDFYINEKIASSWLLKQYVQAVAKNVKELTRSASRFIYPDKIQKSDYAPFTFALKMDEKATQIYPVHGLCYSTLPTQLNLTLPYHSNSFFILNLDRTQLHENEWNSFLITQLGYLHLKLLSDLAMLPSLKNDVIELFTRGITHPYRAFQKAFLDGFNQTKNEIAWLPAYESSSRLLKLGEAQVDGTEFFKRFPCIKNKKITPYLIDYPIRNQKKLSESEACRFTYAILLTDFPRLYYPQLDQTAYKDFISFLFTQLQQHTIKKLSIFFANKPFLKSKQGSLLTLQDAYLEETPIPNVLELNSINKDYIPENEHLKKWLCDLGATALAEPIAVIRHTIFQWIDNNSIANKINSENHIQIIKYLAKAIQDLTTTETEKLKKKLPIFTKAKQFRRAEFCYLPDLSVPTTGLEDIISNAEWISPDYNLTFLKHFFIHIGVHEKINALDVLRKSIFKWIEHGNINTKITYENHSAIIEYIAQHYLSILPHLKDSEKKALRKIPILTCANTFKPVESCYLASAIPQVKGLDSVILPNELISTAYRSEIIEKLLKNIGLNSSLSPTAVIRRSIINWIEHGEINHKITPANHKAIIEYLAKYAIGLKKTEIKQLRKLPLLNQNNHFITAETCYWPNNDKKIPGLDVVIDTDEILSSNYNAEEIKNFFNKIGVRKIRFIDIYEKYTQHLTNADNLQYFFTKLIKYWDNHKKDNSNHLLKHVKKHLQSSCYLLANDEKEHAINNLYSAKFKALSDIAPEIIPLLNYTSALPTDLEEYLGIKNELALSDISQLLSIIKQKPSLATSSIFKRLLEQLKLKDCNEIKSYALSLLAEDNTLQPASNLYYFEEKEADRLKDAPYYLKRIRGLSHEETLELAQLCGVNIISFTHYLRTQPEQSALIYDASLKDFFLARLPFIALQEAKELNTSPELILQALYQKISTIQHYQCEEIIQCYPFKEISVPHYFKKLSLYITGNWMERKNKFKVYDHLKKQLQLSQDIREIMDIDPSKIDDREAWFEEEKIDPQTFQHLCQSLELLQSGEIIASHIVQETIFSSADTASENESSESDEGEEAKATTSATSSLVTPIIKRSTYFSSPQKWTSGSYASNPNRHTGYSSFFQATEEQQKLGHAGEKYVFQALQNYYKNKYPDATFNLDENKGKFKLHTPKDRQITITWLNKNKESGKPYDLVLRKNHQTKRYIEVKSTASTDKYAFEITHHEFIKMLHVFETKTAQPKEKYSIYRVFNANTPSNARIEKFNNPAALLLKDGTFKIAACMLDSGNAASKLIKLSNL
ncbi:uncharacterized protein RVIR1_11790 [Candidatus Rickettsiella viridis]|uniref:Protein NO VEIN C-terminal domain-containing protein n=2 Tax=Candidatus Rickettsiella viridis TaxID=676208 RepID=A0A2Z5UX13_9COXI|nr:uncharacterized protein RVIR1_11790 [Candidatus Rickettsiella viridis]